MTEEGTSHDRAEVVEYFSVKAMTIVDLVETSKGQAIPLPEEYRFETPTVSLRREGGAVIVEAVKPEHWPEHFFDDIRIDDPTFVRPNQGTVPPRHCSIAVFQQLLPSSAAVMLWREDRS